MLETASEKEIKARTSGGSQRDSRKITLSGTISPRGKQLANTTYQINNREEPSQTIYSRNKKSVSGRQWGTGEGGVCLTSLDPDHRNKLC